MPSWFPGGNQGHSTPTSHPERQGVRPHAIADITRIGWRRKSTSGERGERRRSGRSLKVDSYAEPPTVLMTWCARTHEMRAAAQPAGSPPAGVVTASDCTRGITGVWRRQLRAARALKSYTGVTGIGGRNHPIHAGEPWRATFQRV